MRAEINVLSMLMCMPIHKMEDAQVLVRIGQKPSLSADDSTIYLEDLEKSILIRSTVDHP